MKPYDGWGWNGNTHNMGEIDGHFCAGNILQQLGYMVPFFPPKGTFFPSKNYIFLKHNIFGYKDSGARLHTLDSTRTMSSLKFNLKMTIPRMLGPTEA